MIRAFISRRKFIVSFAAIFLAYLAVVVLISQTNTGAADSIDTALQTAVGDERMDVLIQITEVDPLKGTALARILPWPNSENLGYKYKSGWLPRKDITFHVDSIIGSSPTGNNLYQFAKGDPVGGFDVQIDEQPGDSSHSNVSWYPMDEYAFEVPVTGTYVDNKGKVQDMAVLPLDYTKGSDTFDIHMTHGFWSDPNRIVSMSDATSVHDAADEMKHGFSSSVFTAHRSNSTKLLVIIILLLMLTALASVSIMAYMVVHGIRPPTLSALIWSAALTFSLISLRDLLPGKPPVGIFIDKLVYFPALITTLSCSLWILLIWSTREDFES